MNFSGMACTDCDKSQVMQKAISYLFVRNNNHWSNVYMTKKILAVGQKMIRQRTYSTAREWVSGCSGSKAKVLNWNMATKFGHVMDQFSLERYFHFRTCLCFPWWVWQLILPFCIFKINLILFHQSGRIFYPPHLLFSLSFHLSYCLL